MIAVNSIIANVEHYSLLAGIADSMVPDTTSNAAPKLGTQASLNNVIMAALRICISDVPFLNENALASIVYETFLLYWFSTQTLLRSIFEETS